MPATVAVLSCVTMSKVMPPVGAAKVDVTVNLRLVVPLLPSFAETSLMLNTGVSSLRIVPAAWPSVTLAPETFVTFTKNVSLGSIFVSPLTVTSKW